MRRRVATTEPSEGLPDMQLNGAADGGDGLVEVDQFGTVFITHECGLKASTGILAQWEWKCQSCGKPVSEALKKMAAQFKNVEAKGNAKPPTPEQRDQVDAVASKVTSEERKCSVCGEHCFLTTGGWTCKNGHGGADVEVQAKPTRRRAAAPAEETTGPKCEHCGARLTETALGVFYPCGHCAAKGKSDHLLPIELPIQDTKAVNGGFVSALASQVEHSLKQLERGQVLWNPPEEKMQETVTVTWGEECFSPQSFHTYKVGPFSLTVKVREGETPAAAFERANAEIATFAEKARATKAAAYMAAISRK